MAKAFATTAPRPQRSLLFVWHAGEERGLLGSRYFADYPDGADRSDRRAVEHRHDRPQPRRRAERGEHRLSGRLRSHQQRAAPDQPRRQRRARRAADARLRDERSRRSRAVVLSQRPLQLRGQGHSDHLLHDRAAPGLPRQHRRGVEDRVRQDDAHHPARLRNRRAAGRTSIMRRCATTSGRARERVRAK